MQLFRGLNVTHQVIANNKKSLHPHRRVGQVEDSIELLEIQTFKYATEALHIFVAERTVCCDSPEATGPINS